MRHGLKVIFESGVAAAWTIDCCRELPPGGVSTKMEKIIVKITSMFLCFHVNMHVFVFSCKHTCFCVHVDMQVLCFHVEMQS